MTATLTPHRCTEDNAAKFLEWIRTRGGVAVWESINLSNPGGSWSTPAVTDGAPTTKPTWQAASEPARVITDASDVIVDVPKEVKRFHVAVERGEGFSFQVTDGGSRRIKAAVAKAGNDAWHEFDYGTQEAVILAPSKSMTLAEWAKEQGL